MRSFTAALGAVVLFAIAGTAAPAAPVDPHLPASSVTAEPRPNVGWGITFTNPLGRSRGPGAGGGML